MSFRCKSSGVIIVAGLFFCTVASAASVTVSRGLGARHWAGAAISKNTKAISVVVSQTSGTVRLFQNGEVVLRAEPFQRAMKWKDFEYEPPAAE